MEGGYGAHALLQISPLSPSHLAAYNYTTTKSKRRKREGRDCFCSVRSRAYSLTQAGSGGEEGKGNMRARSQFAILWSYQMRTEGEGGEREREYGGRNIYRPRCIQSARPSTTHGRLRAQADRRDVRTERCARFRYHFPIRLGRAGKV